MFFKKLLTGSAAIPVLILAGIVIIYFFFLPPVLKYFIEKEGRKYLGRKVEIGYASLNIFNGSVNMRKFAVYERDNEDKFLSFRKFKINFAVPELFHQVYHIESITLEEPIIHISQKDSTFNFSDILQKFASDTTENKVGEPAVDTSTTHEPVKYIIENLDVRSGLVSYANPDFYLRDTIKNLNLRVNRIAYNDPELAMAFYFDLASGGNFRGNCSVNTSDQSMILNDTISDFNLSGYKHYLEPYFRLGSLKGFFNTQNRLSGNTSTFDLKFTGVLSVNDLELSDTAGEMVAGLQEFSVRFDTISFSDDILSFDTILLKNPVIHYAVTKEGDNFTAMMPLSVQSDTTAAQTVAEPEYAGENPLEMMVEYIQESMNAYLFENYRVNYFGLDGGSIIYDDSSLDDPFSTTIDSLHLHLRELTTGVERSYGSFAARINKTGRFLTEISVNPRDFLDLELKYTISSVMVPDFNPFSVYYIAYPFPRGAFNYEGSLVLVNRKLESENKIVIEKINVGHKVKNETSVSLPVKLAIAILRDRQGDIKLNIPVTGDFNDPKVKIGKLILDILKNLVIKAATAPYDMLAGAFGGDPEDYKELRFEYGQARISEKQKKQLEGIASVLTEKPELKVSFSQVVDREKEKAILAIFEAKKLYWYEYRNNSTVPGQMTEEDSLMITDIKTGPDFEAFLASKLDPALTALSLEEKCYHLAGVEKVNRLEQALVDSRNRSVLSLLEGILLIPSERISISVSDDPSLVVTEYPFSMIRFDVEE